MGRGCNQEQWGQRSAVDWRDPGMSRGGQWSEPVLSHPRASWFRLRAPYFFRRCAATSDFRKPSRR